MMPAGPDRTASILALDTDHAQAMSGVHHAAFASGWSEVALADLIAAPNTFALGCFEHLTDRLTGFILASLVVDEAEILTLAVAPDLRRRGVASRLLDQAIVTARAGGAAALFLEVSEANTAALALYRAAGFMQTGKRPGYYQSEEGADALIMKLNFLP